MKTISRVARRHIDPPIGQFEWHAGELYPKVGFIVTNLSRLAERVTKFYNGRGTAEQWIKEGKHAINLTRLPGEAQQLP